MNAQQSLDKSSEYRPDIDGLRAIAVMAVVLYHYGFGVPGGFVGVDIFFVISGYLITNNIIRQQSTGRFKLADFWKRRIKRIIPASAVVVVFVLIASYFYALPRDYSDIAESAFSQQFMVANIYFWNHTGYFDGKANLKPLLHMWSLAVEEQFYLFFPFVLIAFARISKRWLALCLGLICVLSLGLSVWFVERHPGATFYSLPTRAWELLSGALIAVVFPNIRIPTSASRRRLMVVSGFFGIACIAYTSFYYSHETTFPGLNAVLPCLGASLIILAGIGEPTIVSRLLSFKPLVFVGLISYSLYLWHWPLLVYQNYWYGEPIAIQTRLVTLVASVGLSIASWYFVEIPFRNASWAVRISAPRTVALAAASAFAISAAAYWIVRDSGVPSRLPAPVQPFINVSTKPSETKAYFRDVEDCDRDRLPTIGLPNSESGLSFMLWGDSHAHSIADLCDRLAAESGLGGVVATKSGTPPLLGSPANSDAVRWNQSVLAYIARHKIRNVLLVSRWSAYIKSDDQEEAFSRAIAATIQKLADLDVKVWVMLQVPEQRDDPRRKMALAAWTQAPPPQGIEKTQHLAKQSWAHRILRNQTLPSSAVLDPDPYCFDDKGRSVISSQDSPFYNDNDHLSAFGAEKLLRPLLTPVFRIFIPVVEERSPVATELP